MIRPACRENNEDIHNITKPKKIESKKLYKAPKIIWNNFRDENSTNKQFAHKTMGVANVDLPQPNDFLRKKFQLTFGHPPSQIIRGCCFDKERKPAVPTGVHRFEEHRCKNFIQDNVKLASQNYHQHKIKPMLVFTYQGQTQDLERSGFKPRYVHKKNMGCVPDCVRKFYDEGLAKQQNEACQLEEQERELQLQEQCRRKELKRRVQELKKLWKDKTKEFLLLPVVTDILARIRRRHNLEKELAVIEAQIESLEAQENEDFPVILQNHIENQEKLWLPHNFIF